MFCKQFRLSLLASAVLCTGAVVARADEVKKAEPIPPPKDAAAVPHHTASLHHGACAPQYRTVCVQEWVPEAYKAVRTSYKTSYKEEVYTAYRTEAVPETRTRTYTVYNRVPVVQTVPRTYCVSVPTVEERTVMKANVVCKPVTHTARRCVDKGHYVCKEVCCPPSCLEKLRARWHCCEPVCRVKTVKEWVPCKVWEEYPVTTMQRTCEYVPVKVQVTVCKMETRTESVQVTTWRCVPETKTETYTATVCRSVPYQAKRQVAVCVPVQEEVTCTRMVCRTVQKQVPVAECCAAECCQSSCGHRLFGRLFGR